jgi:Rod binding domain-containing protein
MSHVTPLSGAISIQSSPNDDVETKIKKVGEAAGEFEACLLRQMFQSAKFGGDKSEHGYGSMIVDAMATGVVQGGGLGLAKALQDSLAKQLHQQVSPADKK